MPQDQQSRLQRIEENLYFLEEKVKTLDNQLISQQKELDLARGMLRRQDALLSEICLLLRGQRKEETGEDPPPPHHEPRLW